MSLWKPASRLDCVDLGKDYFLMRFGLVEDYNNVLNSGPRFIGEHFLSIQRWEPNFKPTNASCSLVAVWIRLPKLPFEYYKLDVLKKIGNAIGPVLRIDSNTASEEAGNAEEEGKSDFGPLRFVKRRKAGPNSKGGHVGYHSPRPSSTKKPVMTSGPYAHSSKASPDRSEHGMAQGAEGSLKRKG
ncbi:hypothetical protein SO802_021350 [Lithocarpus litseifolius]|uniref:DUF4283 domain-containing protein n=1 Tax=Lithocarpus litseifolius TaxID=425828 RepID=A0AAW2CIY6_9ROSI